MIVNRPWNVHGIKILHIKKIILINRIINVTNGVCGKPTLAWSGWVTPPASILSTAIDLLQKGRIPDQDALSLFNFAVTTRFGY